jgi:hypothetical protein
MPYEPDPNEVIGICTECASEQPMKYMESSPFTQQGSSAPCKFCGGVTTITERKDVEAVLAQVSRQRGINVTHGKTYKDAG